MKNLFSPKSRVLVNIFGAPLLLFIIYKGENIFEFFIYGISIIAIYELIRMFYMSTNKIKDSAYFIIYFLFIILFAYAMINIRIKNHGTLLTYLMFVSIWICDSSAYIFGSKFGKSRIAESISPKKTWFGSISGFLTVILFVFTFSHYFEDLNGIFNSIKLIPLAIFFGIFSQFGDLFESKIKRLVNTKDSGSILMGHGGILDRFDSIIFVAPFYYYYLYII